jgi:hypothetical protein
LRANDLDIQTFPNRSLRQALYSSYQHKNEDDDKNESDSAGGIIAPARAVRPAWYRAYKQQDQYDQQDRAKRHNYLLQSLSKRRQPNASASGLFRWGASPATDEIAPVHAKRPFGTFSPAQQLSQSLSPALIRHSAEGLAASNSSSDLSDVSDQL